MADNENLVKKWMGILGKVQDLNSDEGKLYLASVLEKLRNQGQEASSRNITMSPGDEPFILSKPDGKSRMVITMGENADFNIVNQHLDWVAD